MKPNTNNLQQHVEEHEEDYKEKGRVLSIQSHVVHGYVGNRSAVFPLQVLGFEVDVLNSVQFSNHTGYKIFKGTRLTGDQLWELFEGLQANNFTKNYTHLLTGTYKKSNNNSNKAPLSKTNINGSVSLIVCVLLAFIIITTIKGYIGNATFLRTVVKVLSKLRESNPKLTYVCDPVMGDHGKLYVPEELVEIYRNELVAQAQILTPNQFECELLTNTKINSDEDAIAACDILHAKGIRTVVITSTEYGPKKDTHITLLASHQPSLSASATTTTEGATATTSNNNNSSSSSSKENTLRFKLEVPRIQQSFTGTGDLMSALILAHTHLQAQEVDGSVNFDVRTACEKSIATVQAVLNRTCKCGDGELKLIQSKNDIENPTVLLRAQPLDGSVAKDDQQQQQNH